MGSHNGNRTGQKSSDATPGRTDEESSQDTAHQRQQDALEQHRGQPSEEEKQVRREQGGHDRPVGPDHKPHPRPEAEPGGTKR